jgi:hypothetical protein
MTTIAFPVPTVVLWAAVVERQGPSAAGSAAGYGPMHAARRGAPATACGQPLDAHRRSLPQVSFASIAAAASTMVCGDCRRAVHRDPEGVLA